MSWRTLERWGLARRKDDGFLRVEIVTQPPLAVTQHGPCGVRVDGLEARA